MPVAVVGFVGWSILLAGCTSGPPVPNPSPAPTTPFYTPSPLPTESPTPPHAVGMRTADGAVAFVSYYYNELVNYGRGTGDWAPVKEASHAECGSCKDFWQQEPSRMDNDRRVVVSRSSGPDNVYGTALPRLVVSVWAGHNPNSTDLYDSGDQWVDVVRLEWTDDNRWIVRDIDVEQVSTATDPE